MERLTVAAAAFLLAFAQTPAPVLTQPAPAIYSSNPGDSWNRLFSLLFTRTVTARYTDEFPDRGPFEARPDFIPAISSDIHIRFSRRSFDRYEEGDRAVDALYPNFLTGLGAQAAAREPLRGRLEAAVSAALTDRTPRSPLARALMQADLWSASDAMDAHRREPIPLLPQLLARLALTPVEIAALPNTYENARGTDALPDLFRPGGKWMEIVWSDHRLHDEAAGFRRAARVFLLPSTPPADRLAFLKNATRHPAADGLAAVALVMQTIAIDASGRLVPTPIATDVQIRSFTRDDHGAVRSTNVTEYELSRRRLLSDPRGSAFVRFDDNAPAYLSFAGNDYDFASPAYTRQGPAFATVATLRTRCSACPRRDECRDLQLRRAGARAHAAAADPCAAEQRPRRVRGGGESGAR